MRLHERESIVSGARLELRQALADIVDRHDLTYGELVSLLAGELSSWAKYMIRDERHPDDPDKPGGIE